MRYKLTSLLLIIHGLMVLNVTAQETKIKLTINNQAELTATMVENSSVTALVELLKDGPLTIEMSDYGNMEKVGAIGTTLPGNDEQITTEPGDIILYQGNALVIYYAPNSWNFTRLGKIDNITQEELMNVLGDGDVTVTLELDNTATNAELTDRDRNHIRIYHNPAENYVKVSGKFEMITLVDMNGRNIYRTKEDIVDVSGIASGIYFLKIESGNNETEIVKIIKG